MPARSARTPVCRPGTARGAGHGVRTPRGRRGMPHTRLQRRADDGDVERRLTRHDAAGGVAQVGAVKAQAKAADRLVHVALTQVGVGAARTHDGAVDTRLDTADQRIEIAEERLRMRAEHLSNRHGLSFTRRARTPVLKGQPTCRLPPDQDRAHRRDLEHWTREAGPHPIRRHAVLPIGQAVQHWCYTAPPYRLDALDTRLPRPRPSKRRSMSCVRRSVTSTSRWGNS